MDWKILTEWRSTLLGALIIVITLLNWFSPEMTIGQLVNWIYLTCAVVIIARLAWPQKK